MEERRKNLAHKLFSAWLGLLLDIMWYAWRAETIDSFINTMSLLLSAIVATLQLSVLSPQLSSDLTRALGWPQAGDWGVETLERVTIQSLSGLLAGWSHTSPHPGQYHVVSRHQVMVRSHHHHSDSEQCDDWIDLMMMEWWMVTIILTMSSWPPQMSGAGQLPVWLVTGQSWWRHSAPHLCGHELS